MNTNNPIEKALFLSYELSGQLAEHMERADQANRVRDEPILEKELKELRHKAAALNLEILGFAMRYEAMLQ